MTGIPAIVLFEQRLNELLRALGTRYVEPDGPCVRFDGQPKPQKATALTFGIDHVGDQAQRIGFRCELKPISGRDLDGLPRQPRATPGSNPTLRAFSASGPKVHMIGIGDVPPARTPGELRVHRRGSITDDS
jgi:hypothetical protein